MRFIHYRSLKPGAHKAIAKAKENGKSYRGTKYGIEIQDDKVYISALDEQKRALDWHMVIYSSGPIIKEIR